jgi:hypothetical protein
MTDPAFSVAVFPFLKTSGPIRIGGHTFRSTTDVAGLPRQQAEAVTEIVQMLFVQGDLRVKSASYAIIPSLDINGPSAAIDQLARLRAVLAYIYASPQEVFGNLFLAPEEVSLALFTPSPVSVFLVRPEHHTESVAAVTGPAPNKHHYVPGYRGLYNFLHYFWVERSSRLYGPKPHMTLIMAQDLKTDLEYHFPQRPDCRLLFELLEKPPTAVARRIHSALHWFNAANEDGIDPDRALLNLAVAFEALLRLPDSSKTERLVDAIALLLGRTERLDDWAEQFYAVRSRVAHEGRVQDPYFYIPESRKTKQREGLFGPLILYGRQIFQLCLTTLLVGADLADRADLQEKFVTNNERYQKICDLLQAEGGTPAERLAGLEPTLRALKRYQFMGTGGIATGAVISAVRYTATTLIDCGRPLAQALDEALAAVKASSRPNGELMQLAVIERLETAFKDAESASLTPEARITREVVAIAWMSLFERYYWLRERNQSEA